MSTIRPSRVQFALTSLVSFSLGFFLAPVEAKSRVDLKKLLGTYTSKDRRCVTVRSLTFTESRHGAVKIRGILAGFPSDVDLGEADCETYSHHEHTDEWQLLLTFPKDKMKSFMIVTIMPFPHHRQPDQMVVTCFIKRRTQPKEYFYANLFRESDKSNINR